MTKFNTRLVHGTPLNDNNTGAINPPVYTTSTFEFPNAESDVRWDYSRSGNPTREFLEKQVADLEEGAAAFAFSSGLAAIHGTLTIFAPGDHIIVGDTVYGGTWRLINGYFAKHGLSFTAVDTRDLAAVEAAIQPNTKAIYFETFTNPLLHVTDVRKIAALAKKHDLLTIVDNTFLTPYLQQPLTLGADIVLHSATKYLGGHSDLVAGIVVTKTAELGAQIYFAQNGLGGVLSPRDAELVRRGIETLAVRMDREDANAQAIAEFFHDSETATVVHYPGLPDDPDHAVAASETNGYGAVLSVELAPSIDASRFVDELKLFRLAVSLGSVSSLAELPYTMTHAELPVADRLAVGITPQLVRLAVGLEDIEDLLGDIKQALAKATK
ncbi:trans-sulfuration enzyme family protein [Lacticaseibacillus yichunensis]|uniref:Trans-sulfuration enzyme family protein n=1 Tax=Lacticaseibacillus yichunensis TaxID=2486015 RepID=A0ABW4CLY7_9LACO|nr:PLP-dependent aspartate aminotransferase family protein [Lacticaseibacillus yichunensis]